MISLESFREFRVAVDPDKVIGGDMVVFQGIKSLGVYDIGKGKNSIYHPYLLHNDAPVDIEILENEQSGKYRRVQTKTKLLKGGIALNRRDFQQPGIQYPSVTHYVYSQMIKNICEFDINIGGLQDAKASKYPVEPSGGKVNIYDPKYKNEAIAFRNRVIGLLAGANTKDGRKFPDGTRMHIKMLLNEALYSKFRSNPELKQRLLATGNDKLVYIRNEDYFLDRDKTFFGVQEQGHENRDLDMGNVLGIELMAVRAKLRSEEPKKDARVPDEARKFYKYYKIYTTVKKYLEQGFFLNKISYDHIVYLVGRDETEAEIIDVWNRYNKGKLPRELQDYYLKENLNWIYNLYLEYSARCIIFNDFLNEKKQSYDQLCIVAGTKILKTEYNITKLPNEDLKTWLAKNKIDPKVFAFKKGVPEMSGIRNDVYFKAFDSWAKRQGRKIDPSIHPILTYSNFRDTINIPNLRIVNEKSDFKDILTHKIPAKISYISLRPQKVPSSYFLAEGDPYILPNMEKEEQKLIAIQEELEDELVDVEDELEIIDEENEQEIVRRRIEIVNNLAKLREERYHQASKIMARLRELVEMAVEAKTENTETTAQYFRDLNDNLFRKELDDNKAVTDGEVLNTAISYFQNRIRLREKGLKSRTESTYEARENRRTEVKFDPISSLIGYYRDLQERESKMLMERRPQYLSHYPTQSGDGGKLQPYKRPFPAEYTELEEQKAKDYLTARSVTKEESRESVVGSGYDASLTEAQEIYNERQILFAEISKYKYIIFSGDPLAFTALPGTVYINNQNGQIWTFDNNRWTPGTVSFSPKEERAVFGKGPPTDTKIKGYLRQLIHDEKGNVEESEENDDVITTSNGTFYYDTKIDGEKVKFIVTFYIDSRTGDIFKWSGNKWVYQNKLRPQPDRRKLFNAKLHKALDTLKLPLYNQVTTAADIVPNYTVYFEDEDDPIYGFLTMEYPAAVYSSRYDGSIHVYPSVGHYLVEMLSVPVMFRNPENRGFMFVDSKKQDILDEKDTNEILTGDKYIESIDNIKRELSESKQEDADIEDILSIAINRKSAEMMIAERISRYKPLKDLRKGLKQRRREMSENLFEKLVEIGIRAKLRNDLFAAILKSTEYQDDTEVLKELLNRLEDQRAYFSAGEKKYTTAIEEETQLLASAKRLADSQSLADSQRLAEMKERVNLLEKNLNVLITEKERFPLRYGPIDFIINNIKSTLNNRDRHKVVYISDEIESRNKVISDVFTRIRTELPEIENPVGYDIAATWFSSGEYGEEEKKKAVKLPADIENMRNFVEDRVNDIIRVIFVFGLYTLERPDNYVPEHMRVISTDKIEFVINNIFSHCANDYELHYSPVPKLIEKYVTTSVARNMAAVETENNEKDEAEKTKKKEEAERRGLKYVDDNPENKVVASSDPNKATYDIEGSYAKEIRVRRLPDKRKVYINTRVLSELIWIHIVSVIYSLEGEKSDALFGEGNMKKKIMNAQIALYRSKDIQDDYTRVQLSVLRLLWKIHSYFRHDPIFRPSDIDTVAKILLPTRIFLDWVDRDIMSSGGIDKIDQLVSGIYGRRQNEQSLKRINGLISFILSAQNNRKDYEKNIIALKSRVAYFSTA